MDITVERGLAGWGGYHRLGTPHVLTEPRSHVSDCTILVPFLLSFEDTGNVATSSSARQ